MTAPTDPVDPRAIDTSAVSDALDSLSLHGHLAGISPRVPGAVAMGPAFTVRYRPITGRGSGFRNAANYVDDVPAGSVIVIDNGGTSACTTWGSILTVAARARGAVGTVVYGAARDVGDVRALRYPLFSTAVAMISGKNRVELASVGEPLTIGGVVVEPGDVVVADDCGVISIPRTQADDVLTRARNVTATERRISEAVRDGMRLDDARDLIDYSEPWRART